jgi:AraC-like DNA-binding protein
MEPAASKEEFQRAPVGKYLCGPFYVLWVHDPTLAGAAYFGRPDEAGFGPLLDLIELPRLAPLARPFDAVVDGGRVTGLDVAAFELLVRHLTREVPSFAALVRRAAVVRPSGLAGAAMAGLFYEHVAPGFAETALFTDASQAFGWLDRPEAIAAGAAVDTVVAAAAGTPAVVLLLRPWLEHHLGAPRIDRAARYLGMSARSLQRALAQAGTSFRAEVTRMRVQVAENLLLHSDAKLEVIGRQVGCRSTPHFSTLFRRNTGEAPAAYRARRRIA